MQSSVFRLLLLIVLALGVLLLLRPGTISQIKTLVQNFSGRPAASRPTRAANPQAECPSPPSAPAPVILATAPAAPLGRPSPANSGEAGETSVSDSSAGQASSGTFAGQASSDSHAALAPASGKATEHWPPPLEITIPTPPVEPEPSAAGNVTVEVPPWGGATGVSNGAENTPGQADHGAPGPPSGSAGQPLVDGPDIRPAPRGLSPPPTSPPDNPLRGIPPPPEQNSGFAPLPQDGRLPGVPPDAGFAPATPNAAYPPPNSPSQPVPPPPTDSTRPDLPAAPVGPDPHFQQPMDQPRPDDRPPDHHTADAYQPASASPPVASGPVQEPPPASRPQASPSYVPPPLPEIRVASLDPRGPSSPPGGNGSASVLNGLPAVPDGNGSTDTLGGSTAPPSAGPAGPGAAGGGSSIAPRPDSGKQLCKGAEKVAQVGSQVILASDLKVAFNIWLETQKKSKKPLPPEQIQQQRAQIEAVLLKEMTEEILVYQDIVRQVPDEALKGVRDKVGELWESEEIPQRMKNAGVGSRGELEEKLEKLGTSLEREKRTFVQTTLTQQWLHQQIKKDDETFTPDEITSYYRQHTAEFEHPARVKWEELMIRKSRHPSRDEAIGLLGHLGNQVLDGAKLEAVARAGSEGSTAREGGLHDWTGKGALVSQALDNAIFSLPVGQLSRIIETDLGYHIVRVVERQDQSVTPFTEAQIEIRNKIIRQRKKKQVDEYLAKLHERTQIWTEYDALIAQQQKAESAFPR